MSEGNYIVEVLTTTGKICETYPTYEDAKRRIDGLPAECLLGTPMLFRELPDTSQRIVREDGKPLQAHRMPYDEPDIPDEPLPLAEEIPLGELRHPGGWGDEEGDEPPLPLFDPDEKPAPPGEAG